MKTRKPASVKPVSPELLREIEHRLRTTYGQPRHHNPPNPLDDLVFVVLSRMTQETKYTRTYEALRTAMPTWGAVMDAPAGELQDLLQDAGLAATKTRHIQAILKEIKAREGALDLCRLHKLSDEEAEQYLTSLPGVARKTARCVMLYALGRDACPVDAHVWRVMKRLGAAPDKPWSERAASLLEATIPPGIRASLHVTLLAHGRKVCVSRRPRCSQCVIREYCPMGTAT